jgi:large subunit ribosomal protein L6
MSRIGKKPIEVPQGVTASIDGQTVSVKGPNGELAFLATDDVTIGMKDGLITVEPINDGQRARAAWGLSRTMVANLVEGVTKGFERRLEINGVGYRAAVQGSNLQINVGYSHDVVYPIPDGIKIATPKPTEIVVSGADKQRVGQVAAEIRDFRRPEPYKGKGIKYAEEIVHRKEGKKK